MFNPQFAGKIINKEVKVFCPECSRIVLGEYEACENFPFASYFAECKDCNYMITESEWNEAEGFGE